MFTVFVFVATLCTLAFADETLVLNSGNFDDTIKGKDTFVKFYAPWCGHCKALTPTWTELSNELKGTTQIAKVDCTTEANLCKEFSVSGYPTLVFITKNGDVTEYEGGRGLSELKKFTTEPSTGSKIERKKEEPEAERESNVIALTSSNFYKTIKGKTALVKFYAPWCGFCKKLAPTYDQLSVDLKSQDDLLIVKVDCNDKAANAALCGEFNVRGFPSLFGVTPSGDVYKMTGGRSLDDLKTFVKDVTVGEKVEKVAPPFVLNTGIAFLDDNYPVLKRDFQVLYAFKKAALGLVFGVGTIFGMLVCSLLGGSNKSAGNGSKAPKKSKKTD